MNKTIILFLVLYSVGVNAQKFYKTFGLESRYHSVLFIQVVDSETRYPINNAQIILNSNMFNYPEKFITSYGAVVLIFKVWNNDYYKDIIGEITHPSYTYRNFKISEYDFIEETNRIQLSLQNFQRYEPTSSEIANELRLGRFNKYARNLMEPRNRFVGMYVLKIEMNRIRKNSHSYFQNDANHNQDRHKQVPIEILVKCEDCNGTGKCLDCNGTGKIYKKNGAYTMCRKCWGKRDCQYCGGRGKVLKHLR